MRIGLALGAAFIAVVAFTIGMFFGKGGGALHFPHACASSRQYLTEFRLNDDGERIALYGSRLYVNAAEVFVDGEHIGRIAASGPPLQHFFCEGNHVARVSLKPIGREEEEHRLEFAVARPSLFHLSNLKELQPSECLSGQCAVDVGFELSPLTPEQNEARLRQVALTQR